jgi:non-ribosomal peptide synthetase component F
VLEDAQARILLTQSHLSEVLPRSAATVIYFDSHEDEIAGEKEENPFCATIPDNLLYVIYTSGSTGIPKGVQISHRGLVNYAGHLLSDFSLGSGDRVLQFAPLTFDTAAEEIFPCLLSGAALVLRTDTMLDSPEIFLQRCREWQVTVPTPPHIGMN